MNGELPTFLPVSWDEIEEMCLELAARIRNKGFKPDIIIGIMRGGWIPARILADLLDVKELDAMEIRFYRHIGETREKPILVKPPHSDLQDKDCSKKRGSN